MSDSSLHSQLPPSSAARNIQCPGSTILEARYPETEDSPQSAEGTAAHWVMSERVAERIVPEGTPTPNGLIVTDQMVDGAEAYYDDIVTTLAPYGLGPANVIVEQPVAIPRVHALCWGTPDTYIVIQIAEGKFLVIVWDYKFGFGIVEVYQNPQLIDYGCGIASKYNLPEDTQFVFKIAQPRAYHKHGALRSWSVKLIELRAHINVRSNAAHEAMGPNPRTRVGPECEHCRGRWACEAIQRAGMGAAELTYGVTPMELPMPALAWENKVLRRARDLIEARLSGLDEQIIAAFKRGDPVPGFAIERGDGRVVWNTPVDQVDAIASSLGLNLRKPLALVTPKQAMEKGFDPALVQTFSRTNPGEAKLVEANTIETQKLFGRIA